MEIITFSKCACANCGEVIEYRASQAGEVVECPKCKEKSQLPVPDKLGMIQQAGPPLPEFRNCNVCGTQLKFAVQSCPGCEVAKKRKRMRSQIAVGVGVIVLLAVAVVVTQYLRKAAARQRQLALAAAVAAAATNPSTGPHIVIEQPRARGPKSIKDLRPGKFVLQKRRGSDFVIAVGDIQNDSENVHHQLRADLDLLDKNGNKIGTVSDFFTEIGPHQNWHFNATINDTNAMSVRFATITEIE